LDELGMSGVFTDVLVRESGIVIRRPRCVFVVHGREVDKTVVCTVDEKFVVNVCMIIHGVGLERGA
jgi:hypothetical protein